MLCLGVIWNHSIKFKDEILDDMREYVLIDTYFEMDLNEKFENFVYEIYYNEEKFKIEKKYNSMKDMEDKKICVVIFEFDENDIVYNEFKKKNVYKKLDAMKYFIRTKYSNFVDNYVFDNVFHCTDDEEEFLENLKTIFKYLDCTTNVKGVNESGYVFKK